MKQLTAKEREKMTSREENVCCKVYYRTFFIALAALTLWMQFTYKSITITQQCDYRKKVLCTEPDSSM